MRPIQKHILVALADGWSLKAHRNIEGEKQYTLHHPHGEQEGVTDRAVQGLCRHGLLYTNHKFPANTYFHMPNWWVCGWMAKALAF